MKVGIIAPPWAAIPPVGYGGTEAVIDQLALDLTPAAQLHIAEQGFDPVYGARPLRRYLQHHLETKIGRSLLTGEVLDGAAISVDLIDGELAVSWANHLDSDQPTTEHQ